MSDYNPNNIDVYQTRELDWRNGSIVYQVIVDRFAPSLNLEAKKDLYSAPRILRNWNEKPQAGEYMQELNVYSQELEFWGGDLVSLISKLDYIHSLGVEVLYLSPIQLGFTNHKYDCLDFKQISPELGSREDLRKLAENLHQRGMKLILDGVFNHIGRNSTQFQDAMHNPNSIWRDWFYFDENLPGGACTWRGQLNLPELNLENPAVQEYLWQAQDSVIRAYMKDGIDGWRLDTAYDLGHNFLSQITAVSHQEKENSLVVGEIINYPAGWMPAMDGVVNYHLRSLIILFIEEKIKVETISSMLSHTILDIGIEPLLKSWIFLDNHDLERLATRIPDNTKRKLAQVLQFTLPGSPNIYYGSEIGMTGSWDPDQRDSMNWSAVRDDNPDLIWTKELINLRKKHRALRVGDFRIAPAHRLLAFERYTNNVSDIVLVIVNPSNETITEHIQWRNGSITEVSVLKDLLKPIADERVYPLGGYAGLLEITMPPNSVRVLAPNMDNQEGYSLYKRIT
jgi:glycosidase